MFILLFFCCRAAHWQPYKKGAARRQRPDSHGIEKIKRSENQTSSMIAISAASPRRIPVLMMRV